MKSVINAAQAAKEEAKVLKQKIAMVKAKQYTASLTKNQQQKSAKKLLQCYHGVWYELVDEVLNAQKIAKVAMYATKKVVDSSQQCLVMVNDWK